MLTFLWHPQSKLSNASQMWKSSVCLPKRLYEWYEHNIYKLESTWITVVTSGGNATEFSITLANQRSARVTLSEIECQTWNFKKYSYIIHTWQILDFDVDPIAQIFPSFILWTGNDELALHWSLTTKCLCKHVFLCWVNLSLHSSFAKTLTLAICNWYEERPPRWRLPQPRIYPSSGPSCCEKSILSTWVEKFAFSASFKSAMSW